MIQMTNLSYKYPNFKLEDINLEINSGEIVAVTGNNGSGKTTLLRLICGLLKPKKGQILIDGKPLKKYDEKIGVVFQNPDNQIIFNSVEDDISFTLKNYKIPKEEWEDRISEALTLVNMLPFRKSETFSLSSGQKQRIVIANMLAIRPNILLLDEATAYLDPPTKKLIHSLLLELKQKGVTIIFTTNQLEEISVADKVLVMENGKIKAFDERKNIIANLDILGDMYVPLKLKILNYLNSEKIFDDEIFDELKVRLK